MRVVILVLLLILNVSAEARSAGSGYSRSQTKKKDYTSVIQSPTSKFEPKSTKKSKKASKGVELSKSSVSQEQSSKKDDSSVPALDARLATSDTLVTTVPESSEKVVVRDTVVDTVYVVLPESAKPQQKPKRYNVPLPRQSAFLGEGLSVGVGAGLFNASKDCDCLGVWQGQLEYHYTDYITGGLDVRFFGGTLDSDVMLMYQRYRLNTRFHKGFPGADFYVAGMLGLETTDLSEFRKELRNGVNRGRNDRLDSSKVVGGTTENPNGESGVDKVNGDPGVENNCEKMFSLDGFTLGVEVGMGLVVFQYLGLVASASYEFNFSWSQLVTFSPGIAFNLQEVWPWAEKKLRSSWVSVEVVFQRYFNRGVKEWAVAGFLGVQFGI